MEPTPIAPGDVVYLLTEVTAGDRIHEIGTSARVAAADAAALTLELGGADPVTVSCPPEHVAPAGRRHVSARGRRVSAFRPATA